MTKLLKAYEERNQKINKIEKLKSLKTPLSVYEKLTSICNLGYDNLNDEDSKFFLKCFGLFDKGEGKFMIRLRIPGGRLNVEQARAIGAIADTYGEDYIDITTRQQIELRFIPFQSLPLILQVLDSVGITTFQTGVDNFRNIVTSPLDGLAKDSYIECMPIIKALQEIFLKREEWIGVLPRKFNTAILGTGTNDCNIFGHDCCFVPAKNAETYGFNLYLGGKVGVQAKDSGLFVEPQQVSTVFKALIELFKKYGFKDNRNKNRLHFLIEAVGMESFCEALINESGVKLVKSGELLVDNELNLNRGVVPLKGDKEAVLFSIPSGVFCGSDLIKASDIAKESDAQICLSVEQSFFIVADSKHTQSIKESPLYQKYQSYQNMYFNNQIACAGTATCTFGVIPNKPDAIEMAQYLQQEVPIENAKVRMYWSACPKGCGIHGIADIGFEGCKAKDEDGNTCYGVHIYLGGKATKSAKEARVLHKSVPLEKAKYLVKDLMLKYKKERFEGESFESYDERVLSHLSLEEIIA